MACRYRSGNKRRRVGMRISDTGGVKVLYIFWFYYLLSTGDLSLKLTHESLKLPNIQHYNDIIMNAMASQINSLTIFYSTVDSGSDQSKHQSSVPLAFVGESNGHRWIPRGNAEKMFPFDDVIMTLWCNDESDESLVNLSLIQCVSDTLHNP